MPAGEDSRHNRVKIRSKANADGDKKTLGLRNNLDVKISSTPAKWKTMGLLKVRFPGDKKRREGNTNDKNSYINPNDDGTDRHNDDDDNYDDSGNKKDKEKLTSYKISSKFVTFNQDAIWEKVGNMKIRYPAHKISKQSVENDDCDDDNDDDDDDYDSDDALNGDEDNDDEDSNEKYGNGVIYDKENNIHTKVGKKGHRKQDYDQDDVDDSLLGRIKQMFTGDRCFYIGLGAKPAVPKMTYEPYQCCPTKVQSPTKVAKATPTKMPSKKLDKEKPMQKLPPLKGKNKALAKPEKAPKGKKGLLEADNIWWW